MDSIEENESSEDILEWEAPDKEHRDQFPKVPSRLDEEENPEITSQESCPEKDPSGSPKQPVETEIPTDTETTNCLNFRSIGKWFRKHFFPCVQGRRNTERANQIPGERAPKRHFRRSKKVHPEESLS
ncbi:transmembrane protein 218 isoform X2 [Marmota monax]|uniref:transmembrane protein 218 isoform X2 n=1 Tax=Marmota monax TaxID=9995 RepID=UPI0026EC8FD8|nr:transmembrane protein 218 isoform X2 [Marmota monax]